MNEPVLLVGETGNGKTSVVQALASACGRTLHVQNLNVQSDSGDLFGGFRPVQLRAIGHELLTAVMELFPVVSSVTANLAFFDQLHRAFREEKWRSFSKGVAQALRSLRTQAEKKWGASASASAVRGGSEGDVDSERAAKRLRDSSGGAGVDGDGSGGSSSGSGSGSGSGNGVVDAAARDFYLRYSALQDKATRFAKQSGDSSHPFAFAFVEGLLVKVRNSARGTPA